MSPSRLRPRMLLRTDILPALKSWRDLIQEGECSFESPEQLWRRFRILSISWILWPRHDAVVAQALLPVPAPTLARKIPESPIRLDEVGAGTGKSACATCA